MSGEVSDESAQNIGRMMGAEGIVSGTINKIGPLYRVQVKAIEVETAGVQGQWSKNIPADDALTGALTERYVPASVGGTLPALAQGRTQTAVPASSNPAVVVAETSVPVEMPVPDVPKVYKIGDTGPAGGIVFYDKGNNVDGWRYLETAPTNLEKVSWGQSSQNTKTEIGTGKQNTSIIRGQAGTLCLSYKQGGYQDWFLPSKDELDLMFMNLKVRGLGSFIEDNYWSSSYRDSYGRVYVWVQNFKDGVQTETRDHSQTLLVRAIRQF
jgi:hypothetical protein